MNIVTGLILMAIIAGIYLTPSIVAIQRRHTQMAPIIVINLFLGWSVVGWVVALAWAVSTTREMKEC